MTTVVYRPPTLSSATPSNTTDKVRVVYTYQGGSCTNEATLNILRPKKLVVAGQGINQSPSCSGSGDTAFVNGLDYDIQDQFGVKMSGYSIAAFETFSGFVVGSSTVGTNCPYLGIQTGTKDGFPEDSGGPNEDRNEMLTPGPSVVASGGLSDVFATHIEAGADRTFWNNTSATNTALQMDQKLTFQGAEFSTGTIKWYCDDNGTPLDTSDDIGGHLIRGGGQITNGTQIPADN